MGIDAVYRELRRIARLIAASGLTRSPFGGNFSVRLRDGILIKRSGASLLDPRREDIIFVPWGGTAEGASVELVTHLGIYERTPAGAVFHLHTPAAVAISLLPECKGGCELVPADVEGRLFLGKIKVVDVRRPVGSPELAEALGEALSEVPAAIVRGHGIFSVGGTLTEAFARLAEAEFSCDVLLRLRLMGVGWPAGP